MIGTAGGRPQPPPPAILSSPPRPVSRWQDFSGTLIRRHGSRAAAAHTVGGTRCRSVRCLPACSVPVGCSPVRGWPCRCQPCELAGYRRLLSSSRHRAISTGRTCWLLFSETSNLRGSHSWPPMWPLPETHSGKPQIRTGAVAARHLAWNMRVTSEGSEHAELSSLL